MLAAKLSDKMRESSNIWAPPIYRRLLSSDKRERDMSERCLLKIRSTILPPPLVLSKVLIYLFYCLKCLNLFWSETISHQEDSIQQRQRPLYSSGVTKTLYLEICKNGN